MTEQATSHQLYQPWLNNYPEGIDYYAPIDTTLVTDQVDAAVKKYDSAVALDFLGRETTYAELGAQIDRFAGALQKEMGVKKGDRVALLMPNTHYFPVAYYAALKIGATVVNCNPLYTIPELTHILKASDSKIIVTLDLALTYDKAEALSAAGLCENIVVASFPKALPTIKTVLYSLLKRKDLANVKGSSQASKVVYWDDLMQSGQSHDKVDVQISDMAVLQFTGGTTGLPKAAVLTHQNVAANLCQIDLWGLDLFRHGATLACVLPFFHIFAMTVCMNVPIVNGVKVVMLPRYDKMELLKLIKRTSPSIFPAVPTLSHALATAPELEKFDISSIKVGISGGAALPLETKQAFAKATGGLIAEGYGLTETAPVLTCNPLVGGGKENSIGQPMPGTDVQIVSIEDPTKFMPPGESGEIVGKGPQIMPGYLNNPEANEDAFVNGYFRTGDFGYVDEDGYFYIVDRIKDTIICSGYNVYPRAIEDALNHHPDVDECNVIGASDGHRGEAPIAFVKLVEGATATPADLMKSLPQYISKIEMPREIILKDELPKTLIGKLSKKELREEYNNGQNTG